ncbi:uncharacterized protein LOC108904193 [Anoplophora glabripennis]|uniref:uncharacterized protein LOC108904193 n=1 Tax=Anoplophora glabripennis TaxID=217634 RepID=UPI0008738134|nr:uncharacterized protein LOC108904193 [Anoplophora glabripennis]XP_018562162.1 uncharacterized protein LOC108904193 [Anoplophora glabripennis]XP_023309740.1 uncharacterized protein LOC108904193 [Anoplophora glabripennis]XP_023309741.1 uncharacterized protein LOC108904193 [Anoplophora glabripennis]
MYSNILIFILLMWNTKATFQADFIVFRQNGLIKSNIIKRNVAPDVPKIREFIVKTSVANRFAETTVLSKVENVDKYAKQTTFSVVLPERAFISGFSMEIDGKTYKAFVKEKEEAEKIYGQSLTSGQTAAHVAVSTRNSNRFTVNVNVEPESKVNFHLTYEELLQREKGQYEVIANIQPGQIVKKLIVEVDIKESRSLLFVRTPSLRSGNVIIQNSNTTQLDPYAKVKISNTSAEVKFYPDINRQLEFACAGLGNSEFDGFAGQFVVQYDIDRDPQGGETLYQDGFFITFFAPPNLEPIAKHIVFVLDTSGSMSGTKIIQLKEAMMNILPKLHPEDLFSIVQYENSVHLWDLNLISYDVIPAYPTYGSLASQLQQSVIPEAILATPQNIEIAKHIVNGFIADGGTNAIGGLEVGLYLIKLVQEQHQSRHYEPILVFLTDGLPNTGISDPSQIISLISNINSKEYNTPIYSLCIGSDADWKFLQELSLATKAEPIRIYLDDDGGSDVSTQLKSFYDKIRSPVLSNVNFNNLPATAQMTQLHFPIFFNGSEITIAGKGVSGNNTKAIKISAKGKKGPVDLEAKIGIPLTRLERVWAYLTVKQLIDESLATSLQSNKSDLEKLALELALNYSLVTEVTSLVVVKPNDTSSAINAVDASQGIFPESPNELPMCNNITNWIVTNFGTVEPTTIEITTEMTTEEITTTTTPDYTTTELIITTAKPPITTEFQTTEISDIVESNFGIKVPTVMPTTTTEEIPITQKFIKTCNDMPFGCCHDGVTTAVGPNYSGCDPIPKSESCSLPLSVGSCIKSSMNKYTIKFAYSIDQGECRPYWYAGCGGNDNRFGSKANCEKYCVKPLGTDRCKLPIFLGQMQHPCAATPELFWFYDQKKDECVKYLYSGCLGNSNRFSTQQECLQICASPSKRKRPQEACSLPKVSGTCTNYELQYYFSINSGQCSPFWYGGCGGNENRFKTQEECDKICINPNDQDACYLPAVKGRCRESHKRWYFDKDRKLCSNFNYTGCYGNKNNFDTREACHKACISGSSVDLQESCFLKMEVGSCSNYAIKWAFNKKEGRCTRFWYGGCNGNDNRFDSEDSCKQICINPPGKDRCKLPKIQGSCQDKHTRWYYNKNKKECKKFVYNGCFGNDNNFVSSGECKKFCA